jgi:hypothetical protein
MSSSGDVFIVRSNGMIRHRVGPIRWRAAALALGLVLTATAAFADAWPAPAPADRTLLLPTAPSLPPIKLPDPSLSGEAAPLVGTPATPPVLGLDLGDGVTLTPRWLAPTAPEIVDPSRRRAMREPWLELKVPFGK